MAKQSKVMEKLNGQIDIDKEVLSVLPKNNKKNLKAYKDKAGEIKLEYVKYINEIIAEMKRRTIRINSVSPNPQIEEIKKQIEDLEEIKMLNSHSTSFEKMGLDELLFVLKRFYKNDLELVNDNIVKCLKEFEKVGVKLEAKDFNYSVYTKEYMSVFFREYAKGDVNSTKMKECFEDVYWKCSDIIIHIELNLRSLYLKNEKTINKYFENQQKQITKDLKLDIEKAFRKYNSLKGELLEAENKDTAIILKKFVDGEFDTKDYEDSNIDKTIKKLVNDDVDNYSTEQIIEMNKNISRLQNTLVEYKNFLTFKFIFDNVMAIYNEKAKYKSQYEETKKKILKLEAKVAKINKKIERLDNHRGLIRKIFNKANKNDNKLDNINLDVNTKILELKDLYIQLEQNKTKNIISTELNDSSTIYDVLLLVYPFYSFLVDSLIKKFEDISQDQIKKQIEQYRDFVDYPNITMLNNVKIAEDKEMDLVIKDKYNLCKMNIAREDLQEDNLGKIIKQVNDIYYGNYIRSCQIDLDDIKYVLQADKILKDLEIKANE